MRRLYRAIYGIVHIASWIAIYPAIPFLRVFEKFVDIAVWANLRAKQL